MCADRKFVQNCHCTVQEAIWKCCLTILELYNQRSIFFRVCDFNKIAYRGAPIIDWPYGTYLDTLASYQNWRSWFFKLYFQTHYYIMKKMQLKKKTSWFQTLVLKVYKICSLSQSEIRNHWQFRWLFRGNTFICDTLPSFTIFHVLWVFSV